jgi:hypothetical protein
MLIEEGVQNTLEADEHTCLLVTGQAFGQAADGALLLASSRARLESALPVQAAPGRLELSPEGAVAFAAAGDWDVNAWPATAAPEKLRSNIAQVSGIMRLSADPVLQVDVQLKRGPASELESDLRKSLERLTLAILDGKSTDLTRENRLVVSVVGPQTLRVILPSVRGGLDHAAENLAKWLRNAVFLE